MKNIYIVLIVLIALSTINIIRNNTLVKNIVGFLLIMALLSKLKIKKTKKLSNLLLTSLFILIGLHLISLLLNKSNVERFDDKEDDEEKDEEKDDKKDKKQTVEEMIDELDKIKKEDIDDDDNKEKTEVKNLAELKPYEAQRETYQLIETVKNLKDTMSQLQPALKEAKSILHLNKQFS